MIRLKTNKRIVFVILMAWCLSVSQAQSVYDDFLEEGKTWTYHYENYMVGQNYDYTYTLQGDTTIHEKVCKKLYSKNKDRHGTTKYECGLFQEGKVIYKFDNQKEEATMLYDFGLKKGDSFEKGNIQVLSIDTIEIEGQKFRCLFFVNTEESYNLQGGGFWVEGIGNSRDLLFEDPCQYPGYDGVFSDCKLNSGTIFSASDLKVLKNKITGIRTIQTVPTWKMAKCVNLGGISVNSNFKGIIVRDGRKIFNK